jgi:PAS domain S-box-containing protein
VEAGDDMSDKRVFSDYFRFRSRGQEGMSRSSGIHEQILHTIGALIVVLDTQGRIVEFNSASERFSGYSRQEVLGKKVTEFLVPSQEVEGVRQLFQDILNEKLPVSYENHWRTKDGQKRLILWSCAVVKSEDGQVEYIVATGLEITPARLRGKRRQLFLGVIEELTDGEEERVLSRILHVIQEYAGCDAAAIRLRKGDDFPYVESIGFSEDFLKQESTLCKFTEGKANRDEAGVATLDCVCGRVIRNDMDELLVPLDEGSVFLTGDINDLARRLQKEKLPFRIRNQCGSAGYSSIALIPLRYKDETVGLLQLNDKSRNKFTEEEVDFIHVAGQSVAAALVRFEAEQARMKSELLLNTIIEKARDGFSLSTPEGKMVVYNEAMERISGFTMEEVNEHGWLYLVFPNGDERKAVIHKMRLSMAGKIDCMEAQITCKDASKRWVGLSISPLKFDGRTYTFATMIDLSAKYGEVKP